MPYVSRNDQGLVESLHRRCTADAPEFLDPQHPEVREFLGLPAGAGAGAGAEEFERLDAEFVRVIEDVIDALFVRKVLNINDMPERAQAKLLERKSLRERMNPGSLRLFGDAALIGVIDDTSLKGLV